MILKLDVSLSIGLNNCKQEDTIEVEIDDYNDEFSQQDIDGICEKAWNDWAWNYVDGGWKIKN